MFRSLLFWSPKLSNPDNCFISEWVEGRADKRPESVSRVVGVQGGRLWGARVLDLLRYGQVGVTWLVLSGVGWPAGKVELFIWHNICCYILKYVGTYNNYTRLDWIRWGEQGQAYFPPVPLLMQEPRHAPGGILWSPYWILWEHAVIWCLFSSWRSDTFDPDASLESIGRCPELNRPKHESILEWRGKLEIVNKEPWFKIRSSHYRTETWFDKIWIISGRMLAPWSSLAVVRVTLGLFIMTACGGDISISIIVSNNISTNVIITSASSASASSSSSSSSSPSPSSTFPGGWWKVWSLLKVSDARSCQLLMPSLTYWSQSWSWSLHHEYIEDEKTILIRMMIRIMMVGVQVCNQSYEVERGSQFSLAQGFTTKHWAVWPWWLIIIMIMIKNHYNSMSMKVLMKMLLRMIRILPGFCGSCFSDGGGCRGMLGSHPTLSGDNHDFNQGW